MRNAGKGLIPKESWAEATQGGVWRTWPVAALEAACALELQHDGQLEVGRYDRTGSGRPGYALSSVGFAGKLVQRCHSTRQKLEIAIDVADAVLLVQQERIHQRVPKHQQSLTLLSRSRSAAEAELIEQAMRGLFVAGKNFGCGSSREHAPLALHGGGVTVVVAQSFARIFFRNAINVGVLPVVCRDADKIADGARITLDIKKGFIRADGMQYTIEPVPEIMQGIIDAGGLVEYAKKLAEVPVCTKSQP